MAFTWVREYLSAEKLRELDSGKRETSLKLLRLLLLQHRRGVEDVNAYSKDEL